MENTQAQPPISHHPTAFSAKTPPATKGCGAAAFVTFPAAALNPARAAVANALLY
jgi:hypothetical protein|tara:strand:- start:7715 stop:7879 length:165 start_codon:yes stop_codon:yes gene_type:complete